MVTCTNPGYAFTLSSQMVLLVVDIFLNAATVIIKNNTVLVVFFVLQDMGIVFAAFLIIISFFDTYAFRAGLFSPLVSKFAVSLVLAGVYLVLSLTYHTWSISLKFSFPGTFIWTTGLQLLYALQKIMAVLYYYFYKRAAFRLGNSQYHENSDWLTARLNAT